jgi:di/tricarboxylate transporter
VRAFGEATDRLGLAAHQQDVALDQRVALERRAVLAIEQADQGQVGALGAGGNIAVLVGVFAATALVSQFISNTSSALVMMPIGVATAQQLGVSPLPLMMGVAMGASASFLTPFANGVSLMVYGPGGYRFGDFWKLGIVVMAWSLLVTVVVVPLYWKF